MDHLNGLSWLVSSPLNKPQTKDIYRVNCTTCARDDEAATASN